MTSKAKVTHQFIVNPCHAENFLCTSLLHNFYHANLHSSSQSEWITFNPNYMALLEAF